VNRILARQNTRPATFADLAAIEPLLAELAAEARRIEADSPDFCANKVWYDRFKPALERLVGYQARRSELRTERAYDIAYQAIYDRLPDCRHKPNASCL
jgi:hypothetical protein